MFEFFKRKKAEKIRREYFEMINGYIPSFNTFGGSIYEMDLTRSCIHSFATHVSKLKPIVNGSGNQQFERMLQFAPNNFQDTTKFLYQMATIYQVENSVFVVPEYDRSGEVITGFHIVAPSTSTLVRGNNGRLYLKYEYYGNKLAIEFDRVGVLSRYLYKDGLFGEGNNPLMPTLEVMNTNNQGIVEGVKNSASIRFFVKLAQALKDEDLEKERKRLTDSQLNVRNNGGMIMLDRKYEDFKQIDSKPYTVDEGQMQQIKSNVYSYFNTNEAIVQNSYNSDNWNAYYEGVIEPFAIQLSLVLTNLVFGEREKSFGNEILMTVNRLQYLSTQEKLNVTTGLFDRGMLSENDGREIFQMPAIEGGDKYYIRKEYAEIGTLEKTEVTEDEDEEEEGEENG